MNGSVAAEGDRTFSTGWLANHSLAMLSLAFILLSFADLLGTIRTMPRGVEEGNLLADAVLQSSGILGLVVYKVTLVGVILAVSYVVERRNPVLARGVLVGANVLMGLIAMLHLSIIIRITLGA